MAIVDDFWSHVKVGKPDECWPWLGKVGKNGYGQFSSRKVYFYAHRHAYTLKNGAIPSGGVICHRCDFKICCNPNHLWVGTHADNHYDCIAKGRHRWGSQKLTTADVLAIREKRATGTRLRIIAAEYGVAESTVSVIANRLSRIKQEGES